MKSLSHATGVAAIAALLIGGSIAGPASPALADHTRAHTCEQAGGTFTAGATANLDRCIVVTVVPVTGPFGRPSSSLSDPVPNGSPIFVDTPALPAGDPTIEEETRDVGEPVVVETARVGTPVAESVERNAGDPVAASVVTPGVPQTTTRIEKGKATRTQTAGYRNCKPVNDGKGSHRSATQKGDKGGKGEPKVQRCERTVVTTTTTPTTKVTTVTTPQERVTTTTQGRETVTTTTTPSTQVFTTTQRQESCVTTTQPTEFTRTTTQQTTQTRSVTYQQRTITTTTTTTYRYMGMSESAVLAPVVFAGGAPNPRIQTAITPAEPLVTEVELLAGPPIVTVDTVAGADVVSTVCTPVAPRVTETDGETTFTESVVVTPAAPVVTVTREALAPIVVENRSAGDPIVTTETRGTGKTCYTNPSTSDQRKNRC